MLTLKSPPINHESVTNNQKNALGPILQVQTWENHDFLQLFIVRLKVHRDKDKVFWLHFLGSPFCKDKTSLFSAYLFKAWDPDEVIGKMLHLSMCEKCI